MSDKYKLTNETMEAGGIKLFRIQALRSFGDVKAGDLGGWVEGVKNLSQEGDAWVSRNAQVYGDAQVHGKARVSGDTQVSGNAWVYGDAWVSGDALVYGDARVYSDAQVYGDARVHGNARVFGNAGVYDNARVSGNAWVFGDAQVFGDAWVYGNARVSDNAQVHGKARVSGKAQVYGDANLEKTPIYIQGRRYWIGYCGEPGYIRSGCECHTISWWLENVEDCARENGYTETEQREYRLHVCHIVAWMRLYGLDK